MFINLDRLKISCPTMYRKVAAYIGHDTGTHQLRDLSGLEPPEMRMELATWSILDEAKQAKEQAAQPQVDFDEENKKDLKRAADLAAAKNCLNEHLAAGLEETDANFNFIKAFVDKSVKGYWSGEIVDAAVANLGPRGTNVLTWRKPEAPPEPEQPVEVLGTLKDGSKQLPLDVTPSKHHTTEQLKDWLARVNANRIIRPSGSFRSSMF